MTDMSRVSSILDGIVRGSDAQCQEWAQERRRVEIDRADRHLLRAWFATSPARRPFRCSIGGCIRSTNVGACMAGHTSRLGGASRASA